MLQPVTVPHKHLNDYASIVGRALADEIRSRASRLEGKRVLHLSATSFGGGVSEILYTLVPLMIDVGLAAEWHVIYGREEFFNATKVMHNALQGNPQDLSEDQWRTWQDYNGINAREMSDGWDVCIVHDPQPAALATLVPDKSRRWVWRCHIDLWTHIPPRCSTCPNTCRRTWTAARTSSRPRSIRSRRRTWRSRPRMPCISASSSAST